METLTCVLSQKVYRLFCLTFFHVGFHQDFHFDELLEDQVHLDQCISLVNARTFMDDMQECSAIDQAKWNEEPDCHRGDRVNKADLLLELVNTYSILSFLHVSMV